MGYGIMPYRVSLGRLATRFGNPVAKKRNQARRACLRVQSQMDDLFDHWDISYKDVVEDLLEGKASYENAGAMYWYAIKQIIEDLGRWLPNSEWYPADADAIWNAPEVKLYDIDSPESFPSPDDFPTVFVVRSERLEAFHEGLKDKVETAQWNEVGYWVKEAKRYRQDLVMFYH
jgi:hypothetical protein